MGGVSECNCNEPTLVLDREISEVSPSPPTPAAIGEFDSKNTASCLARVQGRTDMVLYKVSKVASLEKIPFLNAS